MTSTQASQACSTEATKPLAPKAPTAASVTPVNPALPALFWISHILSNGNSARAHPTRRRPQGRRVWAGRVTPVRWGVPRVVARRSLPCGRSVPGSFSLLAAELSGQLVGLESAVVTWEVHVVESVKLHLLWIVKSTSILLFRCLWHHTFGHDFLRLPSLPGLTALPPPGLPSPGT